MHDAHGHVPAPGDRIVQLVHGDVGRHLRVNRIPDDPFRKHILDRTHVQLFFHRAMFGDVGQTHLVRGACSEVAAHVVVMHRWGGSGAPAPVLVAKHRKPAVSRADPPRGPPGHRLSSITGLISQEPVPVFGVITVDIDQGVCPTCLHQFRGRNGVGQPSAIRLTSELQHPTRDRDGDTVRGQLAQERVEGGPFGQIRLRKVRSGPAQQLILLLPQPVTFA